MEGGASRIAGKTADGWIIGNRLYRPALIATAAERAGSNSATHS